MAIEITHSIPTGKVQEFLLGFLEMQPIPTITNPNDPEGPEISQYTTKAWVKMCGERYYIRIYRNGKDRLGAKTATKDKEIFGTKNGL